MRVLMTLMLCSLVMLGSGWTRRADPAPPHCSFALNSRHGVASVPTPGMPGGHPLYVRFCGPARVLVHLHGAPVRIRGGHCVTMPGGHFLVFIGMIGNPPAAPAEFVGLFLHHPRATRAGTFRLAETAAGTVYARIQLRGDDFAISRGTITIGRLMRGGTFAFRLRDASRVTGSWTCG